MDRPSIPQASHSSANPYARIEIPAIGRVWQALQTLAARLQSRTLQISIRTLAAEAGLASAGRITQHLKQLEADGHIAYDGTTSIVVVITQEIDLSGDRQNQPSAAPSAPARSGDHGGDRVNQPCMVLDHENLDQEEESCAPPRKIFDQELYDELLSKPAMNASLAKKIASQPPGTATDFKTDLKRATHMPGVRFPLWFVVSKWALGSRVEEVSDGDSGISESDRTRRRDRSTRRTASAGSQPAPNQHKRAQPHQRQRFTVDDPAYATYLEQFADPEPASTSAG